MPDPKKDLSPTDKDWWVYPNFLTNDEYRNAKMIFVHALERLGPLQGELKLTYEGLRKFLISMAGDAIEEYDERQAEKELLAEV